MLFLDLYSSKSLGGVSSTVDAKSEVALSFDVPFPEKKRRLFVFGFLVSIAIAFRYYAKYLSKNSLSRTLYIGFNEGSSRTFSKAEKASSSAVVISSFATSAVRILS